MLGGFIVLRICREVKNMNRVAIVYIYMEVII